MSWHFDCEIDRQTFPPTITRVVCVEELTESRLPVVLIYNPTAGALRRNFKQIKSLTAALSERGIVVVPEPTAYAGHATLLARQAVKSKSPVVIVCGGDGTINEVAQALVGTETALAVWPCGTANVLAKELKLSKNAKELAEMIANGSVRNISVGRAVKPETGWQRYFLLMAGIGIDATIVQGVNLELKKRSGIGAYWASGLGFLARMPLTPFSLTLNGEHYESTFAVISNSARYGGWFRITPGSRLDDDQLGVCIFNTHSRLKYLSYAVLSLTGSHTRSRKIVYQPTRETHANSNDEALVQLDGDVMGKLPMNFDLVPEALRVVAPLPHRR